MAKELAQHISLAWVFEVLSWRVAMETSRPVSPEEFCPGRVPDLRAKSLHGTIAAHVVVRFGTYEVSSSRARYAKRV